jgi:hypothetical protein
MDALFILLGLGFFVAALGFTAFGDYLMRR